MWGERSKRSVCLCCISCVCVCVFATAGLAGCCLTCISKSAWPSCPSFVRRRFCLRPPCRAWPRPPEPSWAAIGARGRTPQVPASLLYKRPHRCLDHRTVTHNSAAFFWSTAAQVPCRLVKGLSFSFQPPFRVSLCCNLVIQDVIRRATLVLVVWSVVVIVTIFAGGAISIVSCFRFGLCHR